MPASSLDEVFREVRAEIGAASTRSARPVAAKTCLIAMLPRTGSTALCSLLASTGVLGDPREYLNPRGPLRPWARRMAATDLDSYVEALRREQASPNGVFSMKALYPDLEPLLERRTLTEALGDVRLVFLTRDDLVAQAISAYIADRSGVWHRDPSGALFRSRGGGDPDPPFDEAKIVAELDALKRQRDDWERFFARQSIEPLRITYEGFVADANATVRAIADHVGVEWRGAVALADTATAKLADERSERWAELLRGRHPG